MSAEMQHDAFPRLSAYTSATYDGRAVIGFKGYEVIAQADGGYVLISTPGGHDSPPMLRESAESIAVRVSEKHGTGKGGGIYFAALEAARIARGEVDT